MSNPEGPTESDFVSMPRPTVAPMVLSLGLALLAAGTMTSGLIVVVGGLILVVGLARWIGELLPGRGHIHEPFVDPSLRPRPVVAEPGIVSALEVGMPGYRMRLPAQVHPISAGLKGGIVGGMIMPIPALIYGALSGHGLWYPVNLLSGTGLPGVDNMTVGELEQFHPGLLIVATLIHVVTSIIVGLVYGVLLPTLPRIPKPLAWGGLLMPLLWTAVSYGLLSVVNPVLDRGVDWPWFIFSQFLFGTFAAAVVLRSGSRPPILAGLLGGVAGGLLMPIPALIWGVVTGRGLWYPVNLLAAMVIPHAGRVPISELTRFHPEWLGAAIAIHAAMCVGFGLIYGYFLPRMRPIPTPVVWGGVLIPMLWTAVSYGLMGVVNPLLQERVDWPWFIVSQFVFGITAAVVVLRSEMVFIPPAGRGPERVEEYLVGPDEDES